MARSSRLPAPSCSLPATRRATELGPILSLLAEAPDLPHAEQLQRMAMTRGAIEPPAIRFPRPTVGLPTAPRRGRTRPVSGEPAADALRLALDPLVKVDDALGAEALLAQQGLYLSFEARAEAAQRVAFIYYVLGRDADVRRVADQWRPGATGEWGAQAAWVSGLAAWRMADYAGAQAAFSEAMRLGRGDEFAACAAYWAARAAQAGRRPRDVQPLLLVAARSGESFYGLLARETLGMRTTLPAPRSHDVTRLMARLPNVRRASELVRDRRARAGRADASPPGQDRIARRPARADRRGARASTLAGRNSGSRTMASPGPASLPPTATQRRAGRPTMAGGSIPLWPTLTSSRKAISAPKRSARPTPSA